MNRRALLSLSSELAERGVAVVDGLFSEPLLSGLSAQLLALQEEEALSPAQVGRGAERQRILNVRGDMICWLPPPPLTLPPTDLGLLTATSERPTSPAESDFYQEIQDLVAHFNRWFFMGLRSYEFHYAYYAQGAGYERHSDRFKGSDERVISFITYLNPSWRPGDGGELKIYLPSDLEGGVFDPHSGERHLLVSPTWGVTVCFESERFEHEVLPAYAPRQSVTGWLRR